MSPKPVLTLDWCSHAAAKYAVEHWHYTGVLPVGKLAKLGVWEHDVFRGAIVFSPGANNHLLCPYRLTAFQGCELIRIALHQHTHPTSRIVSIGIRLLRRAFPGLRLLVSFADPAHHHHGGVYQAMNWVFTGTTDGDTEYFIDGKWRKQRVFRSSDWSRYTEMDYSHLPKRKSLPKYRYLYPLDAAMRAQIAPLAKPYPKRATSIQDAPAVHAGESGAAPTVALSHRDRCK